MKHSILLTLLILAVATGIGWRNSYRLEGVQRIHTQCIAAATRVGVSLNADDAKHPIRVDRRDRVDRTAIAKQVATELIAFLRKYENVNFKNVDAATQAKFADFYERTSSFNASQTGAFIAALEEATDLGERAKNLTMFAIRSLSERDPQSALEIFKTLSEATKSHRSATSTSKGIFSNWAKMNPAQSLQWMKANGEKFPELVNDATKKSLLRGMASHDPKMAFQSLSELGLKDRDDGIEDIIRQAKTTEQQTHMLAALRGYLGKIPDEAARKKALDSAMTDLGCTIPNGEFEARTRWITTEKLTPEEIEPLTRMLSSTIKPGEQPKWIEWVGTQLPADKADERVRDMVSDWTEKDYLAAGSWLSTAPAGAVKNSAVRSYAETVSKVDPETAAQWAMTLPPGKERDGTIKSIHRNWPKKTQEGKAAAEAFAKLHGIGE